MDHLKNKITRQKNLVAEAEASVERQRKEVVKAMQKRKIIENLQDKKYSEWETLNFNLERASLDELATMRYSKSKSQLQ
jgi:flagellar export protein FliJ